MEQGKKKTIAVLGCGWLGLPLAEKLLALGHTIKGSTTSEDKLETLDVKGIQAYLVQCEEDNCLGLEKFVENVDVLILTLPPGLRQNSERRFDLVIKNLAENILHSNIKHLIFISSTSVYGKLTGNIDENSMPRPFSESGKQLLKCEELLLSATQYHTTVLRFGGLIGPNRHPVFSLTKRDAIVNPEGEINLIHLEDCINCLLAVIEKQKENSVFNAVTPFHPDRKSYYNTMAEKAGISLPPFIVTSDHNRRILSNKIQTQLGVKFNVENLLTLN